MDYSNISAVAFITGSGSGMGQAAAIEFASKGLKKFALVDLAEAGLKATKAEIEKVAQGTDVIIIPTDVSSEEAVDASVATAVKHFKRIDLCVNSAGLNQNPRGHTHELSLKDYDRVANVNARGLWMTQRAQIRQFLTQDPLPTRKFDVGLRGSIVNIASNSALRPMENLTPYAASKASCVLTSQADGKAYADKGIKINSVCPGVIATAMNISSRQAGETFETILKDTPAGRIGEASEVANLVLFLSHPQTTYINGANVPIDGGYSL